MKTVMRTVMTRDISIHVSAGMASDSATAGKG